jgi:hypothetical protein
MILAMWILVALALGAEALLAVAGLARFVSVAGAYDGSVWALTTVRAVVTVIEGTAAWMLWNRLPPGPLFARVAVLSSAGLLTLEVGFRLAPSSLPPGTRGLVLGGYWVYAALVALLRST